MTTVVLFGGTFDPPHIGHLVMAQLAYEQSDADEVWVIPAPTPPHKLNEPHTPYVIRREMTRRLIEDTSGLFLRDVEVEGTRPSYTVDTVRMLQDLHPEVRFHFLIGSDSLRDLPTWYQSEELTERIDFLVATRAEAPFRETYAQVKQRLPKLRAVHLEMPLLDVSSSFIRTRLDKEQTLCGLVPERVLEVWRQHLHHAEGS